jgi:hypothetical protein
MSGWCTAEMYGPTVTIMQQRDYSYLNSVVTSKMKQTDELMI